jgi:hypothetical protein
VWRERLRVADEKESEGSVMNEDLEAIEFEAAAIIATAKVVSQATCEVTPDHVALMRLMFLMGNQYAYEQMGKAKGVIWA